MEAHERSTSCPGVICYRQRVHKEPKIEWVCLKKKKKKKHPASWKNERKIGVHIGWTHPFRVFPCARTINGIGRICIISTCLPYKNIEMGKRKRMVCFWAHRDWCVRLKVSCVHRLTLDRQFFFFFHLPTAAPTDEERKRIACLWHKCRHRVKFPSPILKMWKQRQRRTQLMNKRKKKKS